jgi:hypothetical protein
MSKTGGFDDFWVKPVLLSFFRLILTKPLRETPANLGYFDAVLMARVENIRFAGAHNLRYAG